MTPLIALTLLLGCPKTTEPPTPPALAVSVGPSPATPVSHLHCTVAEPGEYAYTWTRNNLDTPFTSETVDNGATAANETWTCAARATGDEAGDLPAQGSASVTLVDADTAPTACPSDDPSVAGVAPTKRTLDAGGHELVAYDCPTQLGTSVIYASLEGDDDGFAKYATVGKGATTELRLIEVPEDHLELYSQEAEEVNGRTRGEADQVWSFFAVWNNAGVCFRACMDDWQFYAAEPGGRTLKLGGAVVQAGTPAFYGFDDEGRFYLAERGSWRADRDVFALEDRKALTPGYWEEVEEEEPAEGEAAAEGEATEGETDEGPEEVWVDTQVADLEAPVAVITTMNCPGATMTLPLHDAETGEATGQSITVADGEDWEVLNHNVIDDVTLFEVKKGWQNGWTVNVEFPCGEPADESGDAGE